MMDQHLLYEKLESKFADSIFPLKTLSKTSDTTIEVSVEKVLAILKFLKENSDLHFDHLVCMSGIDKKDHLEVVYHLFSYQHNHQVIIKVNLQDKNNPKLDSVCDLWKNANGLEREIYDFFGIQFKNHPDLRRMFLPPDFVGHPLRKDWSPS